ncbi:MAG: hypothetical protein OEY67_10385 [Gammaproteobacteria bacterium]|nr:hypothetical protein [Gammaproteobacteria bacterium]
MRYPFWAYNGSLATADSGSVTSIFIDPLTSIKYGESSYTIAAPITAGTHTVSQFLSTYRTGTNPLETFFYNRQHFTVLFVPLGNGSVAGIAAALGTTGSTSDNLDTNGE